MNIIYFFVCFAKAQWLHEEQSAAASPLGPAVCAAQALHPLHPEQPPRDFTMERMAKNTITTSAILINIVGIIMLPFNHSRIGCCYEFCAAAFCSLVFRLSGRNNR